MSDRGRSASPPKTPEIGRGRAVMEGGMFALEALMTGTSTADAGFVGYVNSPGRPRSPPLAIDALKSEPPPPAETNPNPVAHASPTVPSSTDLADRLAQALTDLDRHREALSQARSELVVARDSEIDRMKWTQRRFEEEYRDERDGLVQQIHRLRREIEDVNMKGKREVDERVRETEVKGAVACEEVRVKLNASLERAAALEAGLEASHRQIFELTQKIQAPPTLPSIDQSRLIEMVKDLKAENAELVEVVQQEKTKNARAEEEFRMFSRKLRNLQDSNGELRNENESLRTELRKMQYEASENDNTKFYKEKLEQSLYDVESLKSIARTLGEQNEQLRSIIEERGIQRSPSPRQSPSTPSGFYGDAFPIPGRRPSSVQYPSKPAWEGDALSEKDRSLFQEKMKRFEDDYYRKGGISGDVEPDLQSTPISAKGLRDSEAPAGYPSQTFGRRATNPLTWAEPTSPQGRLGSPATPKLRTRNSSDSIAVLLSGGAEDKSVIEFTNLRGELEKQLRSLNEQKMTLTSELQRIPTSGSGSGRHRKKEEIDDKLDDVERLIGGVKMKMRSLHML
ncbi:hypothetical protein HDU67_007674 [Dinochytrium kinnereticum]|nr:hypothetical protein HDU67_007674 [Dinochytrium kinnereticum]